MSSWFMQVFCQLHATTHGLFVVSSLRTIRYRQTADIILVLPYLVGVGVIVTWINRSDAGRRQNVNNCQYRPRTRGPHIRHVRRHSSGLMHR